MPKGKKEQEQEQEQEIAIQSKDELYKIFLSWNTTPKSEKYNRGLPKNIDEFCELYQADRETLLRFLDSETFYDDLQEATMNWAKGKYPEILSMLYDKIKEQQNTKDIKTFSDIVTEMKKANKETPATNVNVINISDEQYANIAQREARVYREGGTE